MRPTLTEVEKRKIASGIEPLSFVSMLVTRLAARLGRPHMFVLTRPYGATIMDYIRRYSESFLAL